MRLTIAAYGAMALLAPAALADCRADVAELRPQVEKVQPDRIKELLAFDLRRAQQEQAEGDEEECREAIDHARKLLRGEY